MSKILETEKNKEYVKHVLDKTENVDNLAYHLQWYLNIAYYAGKQWIAYDTVNKRLFEPPKEPHKVRMTINRVQPIVRTELAKITKNKFVMEVVPASNEEKDIDSSRIGDKVLEWIEYELDLQNRDRENALWGLTCGMGFVKPFWNSNKGDEVPDVETGEVMKQGDVDIDIVSPFECKWDQTAKKWSEVKWFSHEKARSTDYVKEVYGVEVEAEAGLVDTNIYESQLKNLNTNWSTSSYKPLENSVRVIEYWELPTPTYPKGRRITIAGEKLLFYDEDIGFGNEDKTERELPFFPFFHIKIPGRVQGMSIIENLIPVQREYNKSRSQVVEHIQLMANPKWLVEVGSLASEITDAPGEIVEYYKGFEKPNQSNPKPMGDEIFKNLSDCVEEFQFISGQQEVSHGSTPPGVKSGVAIQFLQEQDDTKLGPTISNFIDCKRNYMSYMLKMIRYKYIEPRVIKIVGENKKVETIEFMGSDLTSHDVRVQEGNMFMQSKAAKQEWIFNLINAGILNVERDKQIILKMLELGLTDELYNEENIDINQAQQENDKWTLGDMSPKVRDFFNHTLHIIEHNKFRKSNDYEKLDEEHQIQVDGHVNEHMAFLNGNSQTDEQQAQGDVEAILSQLSPEERQVFDGLPLEKQQMFLDDAMNGGV